MKMPMRVSNNLYWDDKAPLLADLIALVEVLCRCAFYEIHLSPQSHEGVFFLVEQQIGHFEVKLHLSFLISFFPLACDPLLFQCIVVTHHYVLLTSTGGT